MDNQPSEWEQFRDQLIDDLTRADGMSDFKITPIDGNQYTEGLLHTMDLPNKLDEADLWDQIPEDKPEQPVVPATDENGKPTEGATVNEILEALNDAAQDMGYEEKFTSVPQGNGFAEITPITAVSNKAFVDGYIKALHAQGLKIVRKK